MKFTARLQYAAAPEAAYAMLVDRAFVERLCASTGSLDHEVEITAVDGGHRVVSRRTMPTDRFPDAVKSFVGATVQVSQTDEWQAPAADGSRRGRTTVDINGTPVGLKAALTLTAAAAGSEQLVDGDLKASVPLFGGKIEKAAEPAVRAALDAQERVARDWPGSS